MIAYTLLIISSYLALFFSIIILLKKNKHVSDYYLAAWLVELFVLMLSSLFFPFFLPVINILDCVLLFLYIKSITSTSGSHLGNLIFFVPSVLLLIPSLFDPYFFESTVFHIFKQLLYTAFLIGSYLLIRHYRKYLRMNYANTDYADISWLNLLFYGCTFFYLTGLFPHFFNLPSGKFIHTTALFLFMNITGVKAILQNTVFIKRPVDNGEKISDETYANYGLKESDAGILAGKLQHYMETEKPYIHQELCLKDLSVALNVYPHYLTQVLNTVFHQNFYDYVNTYRVEQAKQQLKDPHSANLTILAIAFDCGFNSKSAFNRAFKQKTLQTPSEYRKIDNH